MMMMMMRRRRRRRLRRRLFQAGLFEEYRLMRDNDDETYVQSFYS